MTQKRYNEIPKRQKCVNKEEPYIGGAVDIIDDAKGKSQQQINKETDDTFALHQSEINALDSQNYESYTAASGQTLAQILPATGAVDTIYRVGNWDGTQYDTTTYTEYAWNGSEYKLMDVKEVGIDDVPTDGSHNLVESGGVRTAINEVYAPLLNLTQEVNGEIKPQFELGDITFSDSGYTYIDSNSIIRIKQGFEIYLEQGSTYGLSNWSGYLLKASCKKQDGTYWNGSWVNTDQTCGYTGWWTFVIRTSPYSQITDVDAVAALFFVNALQKSITHTLTEHASHLSSIDSEIVRVENSIPTKINSWADMQYLIDFVKRNTLNTGYFNGQNNPSITYYQNVLIYRNQLLGNQLRIHGTLDDTTSRTVYYLNANNEWAYITTQDLVHNADGSYTLDLSRIGTNGEYFAINLGASAQKKSVVQYVNGTILSDVMIGLLNRKYVEDYIYKSCDMRIISDFVIGNGIVIGYFNNGVNYPTYEYLCNVTIYRNQIIGNKLRIKGVYQEGNAHVVYYQDANDEWHYIAKTGLVDNGDGTYTLNVSDTGNYGDYIVINLVTADDKQIIQYQDNIPISNLMIGIKNTEYVKQLIQDSLNLNNQWKGKKIVLLGTSVGFGQLAETSYMHIASEKLGFTLINTSYPGIAINLINDSTTYCSTLTKAEQAARGNTIAENPVYNAIGSCTNNFYMSYENIFSEDTNDADLYVFAVVPNNTVWDLTDWNAFNKSTWAYNDNSAFANHRGTFLGALIFLLDAMYCSNPNARCVFVLDSTFVYTEGKEAFETIAQEYHISIIDLWGKINTSPKSLIKLKSENGTNWHPSTFAHEIMGNMITNELLLID